MSRRLLFLGGEPPHGLFYGPFRPLRQRLKVLGKLGTNDARELARPDYRGPEDNDAVLDALAADASLI